jgi:tRNA threonylcarbamoyl adenosine modification protein (Sua5/YciO/YrdC/YwlC family)
VSPAERKTPQSRPQKQAAPQLEAKSPPSKTGPEAAPAEQPVKKKKTVGIRVPDNNICRNIVAALGNPIVSTSIYDDDEVIEYTTDPELIKEKWDNLVDIVIDGGFGDNIPSTVIDLTTSEPEVIREGKGSVDIM